MTDGAAEREHPVRALVLACVLGRRDRRDSLEESTALARAIGLEIVAAERVAIAAPRAASLLGAGTVAELGERLAQESIALAVLDAELTPIQQRNLERAWKVKVLDRTGLILEIFAARARSREGRLQVELARLTYQKSRLVRGWSHLERQRGGMGFLGGPGETQIEADRRMLQQRISRLERQLEDVRRTRALHRKKRSKKSLPLVSLVGYTNCGKSTLFNRMTEADVLARDMLFATLDPTVRGVKTAGGGRFLLSDTVGFIRDLPAGLVLAFRATLEEIAEADVLLHIHDASRDEEERQRQSRNVEAILAELGIGEGWEERILHVYNKADIAAPETRIRLENQARRNGGPDFPAMCLVSARSGEGMEHLAQMLEGRISRLSRHVLALMLEPDEEACRAWLHRHGHIQSQRRDGDGRLYMRVALSLAARGRLAKAFPQVAGRLEK